MFYEGHLNELPLSDDRQELRRLYWEARVKFIFGPTPDTANKLYVASIDYSLGGGIASGYVLRQLRQVQDDTFELRRMAVIYGTNGAVNAPFRYAISCDVLISVLNSLESHMGAYGSPALKTAYKQGDIRPIVETIRDMIAEARSNHRRIING